MKKNLIIIFLCILCISGFFFSFQKYSDLQRENERLETNQSSLVSTIKRYQVDSLHQAASIVSLRLTKEELENSNSSLLEQINILNVKLKRVNAALLVATEASAPIQTPIKDSTIVHDTTVIETKCIDYTTPYFHLEGCVVDSNKFEGFYIHIDTLVVVEHRVPKKFLFIKFGTKMVRTEYYARNPATRLNDIQSVVIVDKKSKRKDR